MKLKIIEFFTWLCNKFAVFCQRALNLLCSTIENSMKLLPGMNVLETFRMSQRYMQKDILNRHYLNGFKKKINRLSSIFQLTCTMEINRELLITINYSFLIIMDDNNPSTEGCHISTNPLLHSLCHKALFLNFFYVIFHFMHFWLHSTTNAISQQWLSNSHSE